ncbi:MAG: hypothetical protein HY347_10980 [candidate division NC10 bacterium]|nr:hypothetical protein [candidate division NC10 bacterium]
MVKPKLYLDTSVPSAYFDPRAPDRQRLTRQFWSDRLSDFDPVISTVVLKEIGDTPDPKRRKEIENLVGRRRGGEMREITEAEKRAIWEGVKKEFPDDEMMQEIHYVRRIHQMYTEDLSRADRIAFYQEAEQGVSVKGKSGNGG